MVKSVSVAAGKAARVTVPLASHAEVGVRNDRDPVGLLLEQAKTRVPELVPLRHGRMLVSPFAYFRGAALPMAADVAQLPNSGIRVQLCGDAHLANFGVYASPERQLVFDLNDFDETLPGPFEWDVKRLAASLAVAGRGRGFSRKVRREIIISTVEEYRSAMRGFADERTLAVWYTHLYIEDSLKEFSSQITDKRVKSIYFQLAKARTRDSAHASSKLTAVVNGQRRIVSNPPLIEPIEDVLSDLDVDALYKMLRGLLARYRRSLTSERRHLFDQFTLVHAARKVVGVGSVGTRAWILLMVGPDGLEPLMLQAKEAQPSVLSAYAGGSAYTNQGQRIVAGQRLMQASSDIFLGWQRTRGVDGIDRDYYLRQLRDWKASPEIERMIPATMAAYGRLCGWTLARAHARSGDRVAIAAYLGRSHDFDHAIADFSETYADLNERDYAALQAAVASGRIQVITGL